LNLSSKEEKFIQIYLVISKALIILNSKGKISPVVIIFIQFSPKNSKLQKIFEIKFADETSIKSHLYHYTTPCGMVICASDGVIGDCISC
jgi:hypothetical protein